MLYLEWIGDKINFKYSNYSLNVFIFLCLSNVGKNLRSPFSVSLLFQWTNVEYAFVQSNSGLVCTSRLHSRRTSAVALSYCQPLVNQTLAIMVISLVSSNNGRDVDSHKRPGILRRFFFAIGNFDVWSSFEFLVSHWYSALELRAIQEPFSHSSVRQRTRCVCLPAGRWKPPHI